MATGGDVQSALDAAISAVEGRRFVEAASICRQILGVVPEHPGALEIWGAAESLSGNWDRAAGLFRRALAVAPGDRELWGRWVNALKLSLQTDEAVAALREVVRRFPEWWEFGVALGNALYDAGDLEGAFDVYERTTRVNPQCTPALLNLGNMLADRGRYTEAADHYERVTRWAPGKPEGWAFLGHARRALEHPGAAEKAYRNALLLTPADGELHVHLGNLLMRVGRIEEAIEAFREGVRRDREPLAVKSMYLFPLHYSDTRTAHAVFEEHRTWGAEVERRAGPVAPHLNDRVADRMLRIGYVSPDFREHAVWRWFESLAVHHDRSRFEVYFYSSTSRADAVTEKARAQATVWRDIAGLDDASAERVVRDDRIDVLIDLAGQSPGNRLMLMARKPAPVQATYLGYPGTTGLSRIDHLITDSFVAPPGTTESLNTETLFRLPHCFGAVRPPAEAPPVNDLPADRDGRVTFGSFNFLAKVSPTTLRLWAEVLARVPNSKLLIKSWGAADDAVRERLLAPFRSRGADPDRVITAGDTPGTADHFAVYHRVDIALDTFPYHGTTTTCDALWMGVPVVTLAGKTHVSRMGVSVLSNAGLAELIAHSEDRYVARACELAGDLQRLRELRKSLRDRMAAARLMDGRSFAGDFEQALRRMWEGHCR